MVFPVADHQVVQAEQVVVSIQVLVALLEAVTVVEADITTVAVVAPAVAVLMVPQMARAVLAPAIKAIPAVCQGLGPAIRIPLAAAVVPVPSERPVEQARARVGLGASEFTIRSIITPASSVCQTPAVILAAVVAAACGS